MLKALSTLLALALLGGVAWLGFGSYKAARGFPLEGVIDRVEQALNTADTSSGWAFHVASTLEERLGQCSPMLPPLPGVGKGALRPYAGKRIPFGQLALLEGVGASCEIPGFGARSVITPLPPRAGLILRRRWSKPLALTLQQGGARISSEQLLLEWRPPAMTIELRSEAKAELELRLGGGLAHLILLSGKLDLSPPRLSAPGEVPIPILIRTATGTSVTSGGAPVAANGESAQLLPAGFEKSTEAGR